MSPVFHATDGPVLGRPSDVLSYTSFDDYVRRREGLMIRVTITECKSGGQVWVHTARTADQEVALDRALRRYFGRNAWLSVESGIKSGVYGQVCIPAKHDLGASHCITGRVRVDRENHTA